MSDAKVIIETSRTGRESPSPEAVKNFSAQFLKETYDPDKSKDLPGNKGELLNVSYKYWSKYTKEMPSVGNLSAEKDRLIGKLMDLEKLDTQGLQELNRDLRAFITDSLFLKQGRSSINDLTQQNIDLINEKPDLKNRAEQTASYRPQQIELYEKVFSAYYDTKIPENISKALSDAEKLAGWLSKRDWQGQKKDTDSPSPDFDKQIKRFQKRLVNLVGLNRCEENIIQPQAENILQKDWSEEIDDYAKKFGNNDSDIQEAIRLNKDPIREGSSEGDKSTASSPRERYQAYEQRVNRFVELKTLMDALKKRAEEAD